MNDARSESVRVEQTFAGSRSSYKDMQIHPVIVLAATGFMLTAAISDVRHRRISNRLNLAAAATGLLLQLLVAGPAGVLAGVQGLAVGLLIMFVPFACGMLGGGDVKFVAAIGTFFGWQMTLVGLAIGVLLGGVVGAASLLLHGRFVSAMRGVAADLVCLSNGVRPTQLKESETVETVPYGVLLAIGMACSVVVAVMEEVPWASQ